MSQKCSLLFATASLHLIPIYSLPSPRHDLQRVSRWPSTLKGRVLSALVISSIVFACVLGGALLGIFIRSRLPEHHVNEDSKYIFKLGMGLLATLAALVLGLLIASAKK